MEARAELGEERSSRREEGAKLAAKQKALEAIYDITYRCNIIFRYCNTIM